jgi:DNA replication protein DnaC
MLINQTVDKLHSLRLSGMAEALADQLEHPDRYGELEFTTRLGLLVDRETQDRDNRRLTRNLKTAHLRTPACVEDIDFRRPRGLDRTQILSLAQARWVSEHRDLLISGATGCGKTYLACALAHAAIRRGHKALYWRTPQRRSTIITSQLPINTWHDNLGEPTLADAICDRILHTAHRIELRGESLRKPAPTGQPADQS